MAGSCQFVRGVFEKDALLLGFFDEKDKRTDKQKERADKTDQKSR
jgi:hypothetical protein